MGINLQNNNTHLPGVELEVAVEEDDGEVYLLVLAEDPESGATVWEYYASDPNEIVAFFGMVASAKADYENRHKAK